MTTSHLRVTYDPAGTVAAGFLCLAVIDDTHLCHLTKAHHGSHLALPVPWPRRDVTKTNPAYVKAAA